MMRLEVNRILTGTRADPRLCWRLWERFHVETNLQPDFEINLGVWTWLRVFNDELQVYLCSVFTHDYLGNKKA